MKATDAWDDAQNHDRILRDEIGIVEQDEPTPASHAAWERESLRTLGAEFTPQDRRRIRLALGLWGDHTKAAP